LKINPLTEYLLHSTYIQVTDYAEDQEILSTGNELEDAIVAIRNKQAQKTAEKLARERELAKVMISKEHVELMMHEMELPKEKAERTLREHGGDVVKALTALVNAPA
jgi:NACalpha-BTF3-like transcription factor